MTTPTMPALRIGDLVISPPIIQGAMGVRVSRSGLAAAVANEGCVGMIASVGLGDYEHASDANLNNVSNEALRDEIREARALAPNGIIGVNVMTVLSNFAGLIGICVEEEVDLIVCGAGLPLDLPKYLKGKDIKLVPIVSSARALNIICRKWKQQYDRLPDAVIVEGPEAGGHLGYSFDDLQHHTAPTLEQLVTELVAFTRTLDRPIPVIAAGGIFDGADIARFLKLGASGVQMATRFVCTDECDVHPKFKQAYLDAGKEDTLIINSPVGLPGRVIRNEFVDRVPGRGRGPVHLPAPLSEDLRPEHGPLLHRESAGRRLTRRFRRRVRVRRVERLPVHRDRPGEETHRATFCGTARQPAGHRPCMTR